MITSITQTAADPITLNPMLQAILDAPLPAFRRPGLRREPRTVWAVAVRKLFREIGLKGISVTAPKYSMAHSIDIKTPRNEPEPTVKDEHGYDNYHPEYLAARNAALAKVEAIIVAAFPDLDNRSDFISDYFDYCLSIS
jgi:hypothetical protein